MAEYNLLLKARELQEIDRLYHDHVIAFMSARARDRKKVGKSLQFVYDRFSKFFDYEGRVEEVLHPEKKREKEQSNRSKLQAIGEILNRQKG